MNKKSIQELTEQTRLKNTKKAINTIRSLIKGRAAKGYDSLTVDANFVFGDYRAVKIELIAETFKEEGYTVTTMEGILSSGYVTIKW